MAYLQFPLNGCKPGDACASNITELLEDIASRKEFQSVSYQNIKHYDGFTSKKLFLPGLRLTGEQTFIRNFENPNTNYPRSLIKWQTGTGKSIAAISISSEFIRQFRIRASLGETKPPVVFIISFTAKETIQEDMLRYPEFGFVSQFEVEELRRLRILAGSNGSASPEARQLSGFIGVLRRRITDRNRGGYYQFYGYKEFANKLFVITQVGLDIKFDVSDLYNNSDTSFAEQLTIAVKKGLIIINEELLDELRGGFLLADEIHNVYNILEKNNYGIAIQYVLDVLGPEAPRAAFMSATPITGSASEIVDLLNLLIPLSELGTPLQRSDFFTKTATRNTDSSAQEDEQTNIVVSHLREGALEKIALLAAGRVSFLLDSDVGSYPRRIFVGQDVIGLPYLKLTFCPMSQLHERSVAYENPTSGFSANAYTLYDMAFPNPDSMASHGLYKSGETSIKLSEASEDWRAVTGVIVEKGTAADTYIITGAFLGPERLQLYSTKFARIVAAAIDAIRAGPGKIMIYHHRVRMSGVLLLQEAFRMNGFADEFSNPTDSTICAICGIARSAHDVTGDHHIYTPARFVVAHSDVEKVVMMRSISQFNALSNLLGHQYRVLIGSKIIREGLNFRAVRYQFIASLPTDYPTLIQIFGRVVRKDSHNDLPVEDRNVKISIFVSTFESGKISSELQRYIDKGREYLIIQEVERSLHVYAIDGFANYDKILKVIGPSNATIDALPYAPIVLPAHAQKLTQKFSTFLTYGYGEKEVAAISAVCRVLFHSRPVWTYVDLWDAVKNMKFSDEGNFASALENIQRVAGEHPTVVVKAGIFYILAVANSDKHMPIDIESYIRNMPLPTTISIRASDYIQSSRSDQNWSVRLRDFENTYLILNSSGKYEKALELSLVEYGAIFHYTLIRKFITLLPEGQSVTIDDLRVIDLYRRFHVVVTSSVPKESNKIIGYLTPDAVNLYDLEKSSWYSAAHTDYSIGRRHIENDIVVGFVVSQLSSNTDIFVSSDISAKFKIRLPLQKIKISSHNSKVSDMRNLARGAVCETRHRSELEKYVHHLHAAVSKLKIDDLKVNYITPGRFPSIKELSDMIRYYMLILEENSRNSLNGMISGTRWIYLYCDRMPSISALMQK